jgi:SPX domain protein involved in polyphosphate accumulation
LEQAAVPINELQIEKATWERFESKYIITERTAAHVIERIRMYTSGDNHALDPESSSYPVTSVYLDTLNSDLMRQTFDAIINRVKLRIRFYGTPTHDSLVFFEVKRRWDRIIQKTRSSFPYHAVDFVRGTLFHHLDPQKLVSEKIRNCYEDFLAEQYRYHAFPCLWVRYRRQAFQSIFGDYVRITIDRKLQYSADIVPPLSNQQHWFLVDPNLVILEIKFTNTFPSWVKQIIESVELDRKSISKYLSCGLHHKRWLNVFWRR